VPTYQYVCTECHEPLEAVQSFSDAALTDCPVCGGRLRKVFSAVGVVFKGSGFYKTDSRSGSGGADGSGDKGSSKPAGDTGTSGKGDSGKGDSGKSGDAGGGGGKKESAPAAAKAGGSSSTSGSTGSSGAAAKSA